MFSQWKWTCLAGAGESEQILAGESEQCLAGESEPV